jgi:signal transduction histidine kinase
MPQFRKIWAGFALSLVLVQTIASLAMKPGVALVTTSDLIQCLLLLSGTLAFLPIVAKTRGRIRGFWSLMMLGVALWFGYQLLWTYFEVVLRKDVPNPFSGDVVLFLHFVPMMGALALQPHLDQDERTARLGWLDFGLLFVWWLYLYSYAVLPWQYVHVDAKAYIDSLNLVYLTEKIAFLGGLSILLVRDRGQWRHIYAQWFGASLLYAFSSYLANWAIAENLYTSGSLYDIPLVISMAWITILGLLAWTNPPCTRAAERPTYSAWVARLGMLAIFSLPVFAIMGVVHHRMGEAVSTFRLVLTLGIFLLMGAMVFLKQHLLDKELLFLLKESRQALESLKHLQAKLVQSEQLASLGQLAGGAAHELNNPLTAMLGYSELLESSDLDADGRELAQKICHQVRRTKMLVASLLSFAKGGITRRSLVDMNALLQTTVKISGPRLSERKVATRLQLTTDLPRVRGDSNQLLQVCLLMTNHLLEAAPSGGELQLTTRNDPNWVVIEVCYSKSDIPTSAATRPGPSPDEHDLGLSGCLGIIHSHQGHVTCENQGSSVHMYRIELPLAGTRDEVNFRGYTGAAAANP